MGWRRWVQIRETGKRLQQRGHEVVGVNADQPDCRGFDLVHLFNCRVEGSFHQQMASCKAAEYPWWYHQYGFHLPVPFGAAGVLLMS